MEFDNIISLTITRNTPTVSRKGFGTTGILGYHTKWADYNRRYLTSTALNTLVSEGFATTDPIYLAALAAVGQNPRNKYIEVLRRATTFVFDLDLEITSDTGDNAVTVSKGGTSRTYGRTGLGTGTTAEATALAAEMNADASGWGSSGSAELTITSSGAVVSMVASGSSYYGMMWFFDDLALMTATDQTADPGLAADLAAIDLNGTQDFYCMVAADAFSKAQIDAIATWASTKKILFGAQTQDAGVPTSATDDVASELQDDSRENSWLIVKKDTMANMPAAGWSGYMLSTTPGNATWAYKRLTGVQADAWTQTQMDYIGHTADSSNGKNANHYTTTASYSHTYPGVVSSGEFIDIIRTTHYIEARIKEEIFLGLVSNDKIDFDDDGIAQIEAAITRVLSSVPRAIDVNSIVVDVPALDDIDTADITARNLNPVTFGARLIGAIHKTTIAGELYL